MKDFDLELAKQGHPLVTVGGGEVLKFVYDERARLPIICLTKYETLPPQWTVYSADGKPDWKAPYTDSNDLRLADIPGTEEELYFVKTGVGGASHGIVGYLYNQVPAHCKDHQKVVVKMPGVWKKPEEKPSFDATEARFEAAPILQQPKEDEEVIYGTEPPFRRMVVKKENEETPLPPLTFRDRASAAIAAIKSRSIPVNNNVGSINRDGD